MALTLFEGRGERNTILSRLNPISKIIGLVLLSSLLMESSFLLSASAMCLLIMLSILTRLPVKDYLRNSRSLLVLAIFIFATDYITSKDLFLSFYSALRFFFLILSSSLFLDSTSAEDASSSIGRLLSPVLKEKAWIFSSYIMLTLWMLPLIFSTSSRMKDARACRQGRFLSHPVKNIGEYTYALLAELFYKLKVMDMSLSSRMYDEKAERISLPFRKRDAIVSICLIVLLALSKLV